MTVSDNNLKSFIAAYIHLSTRVALHHMKRDKNPLKEKPNTERPIQPNTWTTKRLGVLVPGTWELW